MQDKKIKIRLAKPEDSESIFKWRNDNHSREMSFASEILSLINHLLTKKGNFILVQLKIKK